jgi:hypothetical protein
MKAAKYIILISAFLFVANIFSCKKENKDSPQVNDEFIPPPCDTLPPVPYPDWTYFDSGQKYIEGVNFNPENPDEVCYIERVIEEGEGRLYTYNFSTKQRNYLFEDRFLINALFAKDNWIFFQITSPQGLYKIKSNGTKLTEIKQKDNYPLDLLFLSNDKTKVICRTYRIIETNEEPTRQYMLTTLDNNGNVLNELDIIMTEKFMNPYNYSLFVLYNQNLYFININTLEKTMFLDLDSTDAGDLSQLIWLDGNNFMVDLFEGIYKGNLQNGLTQFIKRDCLTRNYYMNSYSPKTNMLLCRKYECSAKADTLFRYFSYTLMSPDGKKERVLDIPYWK